LVKAGEWIHVPVKGDPWPVMMRIGDAPSEPAFIDHELVGSKLRTFASRRCPDLPPGSYVVSVSATDWESRVKVRVIL
jgi:hypothetical protein